jgi:hypothetical protein
MVVVVPALEAALRQPGFAAYDEETPVALAQAWREGRPLDLIWGQGNLHRALCAASVWLLGPSLRSLRLPSLLATTLEGPLLLLWLRPRLGERAALWACLAQWVGTAALLRARMVCSPALLPCVFLAHAVWLDRCRRPWQQALFGLSVCAWLLDYDAWLLAAAVLLGWWLAKPAQRHPGKAAVGVVVGLLALGLAAILSPGVAGWARTCRAFLLPDRAVLAEAWGNLRALLSPGPRLPFSGVGGWPWPAPWIWPLVLLGCVPALRRWPSLALLLLVGVAPLVLAGTATEPHRMELAHLGLATLAGAGAARLWRWRWGPAALACLLALGLATESAAFWTRDPAGCRLAYGRSQDELAAAGWLRAHAPAQGWTLLDGLGPWDDAAWRLLLDARGVPRGAGPAVAMLPWDYQPGLRGLHGTALALGGDGSGVVLFFPDAAGQARLESVGALTAPLARLALTSQPQALAEACHGWLDGPGHGDPWARSVAWELWLHASLQDRQVDLRGVDAMLAEPLVSGWGPDVLSKELASSDPARAGRCAAKALQVDPRRGAWTQAQRVARF